MFLEHGFGEAGRADDPTLGHLRKALHLAGRLVLGQPSQVGEVFLPAAGRVGEFAGVRQGRFRQIPSRALLWVQQPSQAGPAVVPQAGDGPQFRPDRIEVDVVAERAQSTIGVHEHALVAPLEKMATLIAQAIKAGGEGALQPPHAFHQVGPGGGDGQVVVVRHQAPGVDLPAGLGTRFPQAPQERRPGLVGTEDVRPVVAPVQHVIDT